MSDIHSRGDQFVPVSQGWQSLLEIHRKDSLLEFNRDGAVCIGTLWVLELHERVVCVGYSEWGDQFV